MVEILRDAPIVAPRSRGRATVDDGMALKSREVQLVGPPQEFRREIPEPIAAMPALVSGRKASW